MFKKIGGKKGHEEAGPTMVGREAGTASARKDVSQRTYRPLEYTQLLYPLCACSQAPKIGLSTWRRRMEETVYQKLGWTKADMDENTGNLEDKEANFHAAVENLQQLYDQVERVRKASLALDDAYDVLSSSYSESSSSMDVSLADAVRGREEGVMHTELIHGWVLHAIEEILQKTPRVLAVIKQRHDVLLDYFARKRKFDNVETKVKARDYSSKLDDNLTDRRAKFEHSKAAIRTVTEALKPLLETFDEVAKQCRTDTLRVLAVSLYACTDTRAQRLRPFQDSLGDESAAALALMSTSGDPHIGCSTRRPHAPPTDAFERLVTLLDTLPELPDYHSSALKGGGPASSSLNSRRSSPGAGSVSSNSAGSVYGAPLESIHSPPVSALVAMLNELEERGGVDRQGIFRIPGNSDDVEALKVRLDANEPPREVLYQADLDDVATLTKMWFRERADPGFLEPQFQDALRDANSQYDDDAAFAQRVENVLCASNSPAAHCLTRLLDFLRTVSDNARVNMMTAENLAICFAPNILLRDPTDPAAMVGLQPAISLMERLIKTAHYARYYEAPSPERCAPFEYLPPFSARRPVRPASASSFSPSVDSIPDP